MATVSILARTPTLKEALSRALPALSLSLLGSDPNKIDVEGLKNCEILIADLDLVGPYLYDLGKVKWIQSTWAGVNQLVPFIDKAKGPPRYPIARFTGAHFGKLISEYVVAQIVGVERDFDRISANQKARKWEVDGRIRDHRSIGDMTIGILGVGAIGSYVGKVLKVLGATTWGLVRTRSERQIPNIDHLRTGSGLKELISACDCVVSVLPDSEESRGLLSLEVLSGAVEGGLLLVNVGRGSLIEDTVLVEAVSRGYIRAAVLDVFNTEPLPQDSPLWSLPQVKITPHMSGISRAEDIVDVFSQNLKLWNSNLPLQHTFDYERGY